MRKILSLVLAIALAFCMVSFPANAEEVSTETMEVVLQETSESGVYAFSIPADEEGTRTHIVDKKFTMTSDYADIDRSYSQSSIMLSFYMKGAMDSAPGNRVWVNFSDYYGNVIGMAVYADKAWYGYNVSVIPGRLYYLEFINLDTPDTLWCRMQVD